MKGWILALAIAFSSLALAGCKDKEDATDNPSDSATAVVDDQANQSGSEMAAPADEAAVPAESSDVQESNPDSGAAVDSGENTPAGDDQDATQPVNADDQTNVEPGDNSQSDQPAVEDSDQEE